ncbi:uncharacterized protein N7482_003537 [Penicillium canariense]|uniref:Uncharacterized protein n=1 Tax=Penicillium canariense TaxID=189055 RepID=A0A9W9I6U8_9EURO|nr:uncharacterized protein N7482_003537 [Penicillium canariense]KAJ5167943.1 hypothetical protein N7482_003537 [Penicillium canariense]
MDQETEVWISLGHVCGSLRRRRREQGQVTGRGGEKERPGRGRAERLGRGEVSWAGRAAGLSRGDDKDGPKNHKETNEGWEDAVGGLPEEGGRGVRVGGCVATTKGGGGLGWKWGRLGGQKGRIKSKRNSSEEWRTYRTVSRAAGKAVRDGKGEVEAKKGEGKIQEERLAR